MKQAFLAVGLIVAAVALFSAGRMFWPTTVIAEASLGDLTAMQTIVSDTAAIAKTGDLKAAEVRISDLETAWDDAQPTLQPKSPEAWGRVDGAADAAFKSLRAATPDPAAVNASLLALTAALTDPSGGAAASAGNVGMVGNIPVTDASGHPLPCESMLKAVAAASTATPPAGDKAAKLADLLAKATERCNADDDQRADALSAAALQELATN